MYINKSKKIVIKIGSSIIVDDKGKIRKKWLDDFVKDIILLINLNKKVIIVSSGAIALGCNLLNISKSIVSVKYFMIQYFQSLLLILIYNL